MVQHITAATSIYYVGAFPPAFSATGPDTLIVDADAYIISTIATAVDLTGTWNIQINGQVEVFEHHISAMFIHGTSSDTATVKVGPLGDISNSDSAGGTAFSSQVNTTLFNRGSIATHSLSFAVSIFGEAHVTNVGSIIGRVRFGDFADTFKDFGKVNGTLKYGTVDGVIDLGGGNDHFFGGKVAESVRDGGGADVYSLGDGNDRFLAIKDPDGSTLPDEPDTIAAGRGKDTYDLTGGNSIFIVNLDDKEHIGLQAHSAVDVFGDLFDKLAGFENVVGSDGIDAIFGSKGANVLNGGEGSDALYGLGGRDVLIGGDPELGPFDNDTFYFTKVSDSGTTAATRDLILDFHFGDKIDLTAIDANKKTAIDDAFVLTGHSGADKFTHHAGELRYFFSKDHTIVAGDVNGDGKADFAIETASHFLLSEAQFNL
jgi:Ca2+-binding RTX toxin-like protein